MFIHWKVRVVVFLLVIFILTSSCGRHNDRFDEDTKKFANYLLTYLHQDIPKDSTNYILISDYGCHSCIETTVDTLYAYDKTIIIVSPDGFRKYFNKPSSKVFVDSSMNINRLKYCNGNVGIVQTANGYIYSIINPERIDLDSIIQVLRR